ncbi:MAG: PepSY-associated TM helix domain-containing protein [Patulibacter minatonensis]
MFRVMQVGHRWLALVLGTVLLLITVSGSLLVYKPELLRGLHPNLFAHTSGEPIGFERALASAREARPGITPTFVQTWDGNYLIASERGSTIVLDAATGRFNGTFNPQAGVWGFLDNLHECALSCASHTGYVAGLAAPVGWIFGEELTWAALILGSVGLLLAVFVASGLVIWWPGIRKLSRGFTVRRRTNRYKLNYDLHKVVGAVALPFLAVWALTGAGFELPFVADAWYGALPGEAPAEPTPLETRPGDGNVSLTEATAIAAAAVAGGRTLGYTPVDRADPKASYEFWVASRNDPYDHSPYGGNVQVQVDRHSGATRLGYGAPGSTRTPAEDLWEHWSFAIHAGTPVNGWWRILWLLLGMSPLLLAVTGTTTWWIRRRKRRAKARRRKGLAGAAA